MNRQRQFIRTAAGCVLLVFALLGAAPVHADGGEFLGATTLLDSGDTATKIDIVFLGDGFTSSQQDDFNKKVDKVVEEFLAAHPVFALRSAFNIHRVNVASPESGTDKFSTCGTDTDTGDSNQQRQTALDAGYCAGGDGTVYRCMFSNNTNLALEFANNAPDDNFVVVLVNDSGHGGCASGNLSYMTVEDDFEQVAVHEFGHSIFNLADEYQYDSPDDTFTGIEPGRANVTANRDKATLKWGDLVLESTPVPTQPHGDDCSDTDLPDRDFPEDIVGTFEGATTFRCGVYRPQYFCRMRESHRSYCDVCRRQVIRTLLRAANPDRVVTFHQLKIKDDNDPWPRGDGEIYMKFDLSGRGHVIKGRWPADDESDFDDDQTKTIDVVAGVLPQAATDAPATLALRVRESDWPDGDDDLSSDTTIDLPDTGNFSIDKSDYKLDGDVVAADLRVLFDVLNVKDDQDGFLAGDGDIYVLYTIRSGDKVISGRWPQAGDVGMSDDDSHDMSIMAAAVPRPPKGEALTMEITVRDADSWFTGGDDDVGSATFTFDETSGFGANNIVHVQDASGFRLTLSVLGR
jgi:hypothetical protein